MHHGGFDGNGSQVTPMKRIERPIGVYVMTAYDSLVVGVIPLLTFVFAVRASEEEFPFFLAYQLAAVAGGNYRALA